MVAGDDEGAGHVADGIKLLVVDSDDLKTFEAFEEADKGVAEEEVAEAAVFFGVEEGVGDDAGEKEEEGTAKPVDE